MADPKALSIENLRMVLSENNIRIIEYIDIKDTQQKQIIDKLSLILDDINGKVV